MRKRSIFPPDQLAALAVLLTTITSYFPPRVPTDVFLCRHRPAAPRTTPRVGLYRPRNLCELWVGAAGEAVWGLAIAVKAVGEKGKRRRIQSNEASKWRRDENVLRTADRSAQRCCPRTSQGPQEGESKNERRCRILII